MTGERVLFERPLVADVVTDGQRAAVLWARERRAPGARRGAGAEPRYALSLVDLASGQETLLCPSLTAATLLAIDARGVLLASRVEGQLVPSVLTLHDLVTGEARWTAHDVRALPSGAYGLSPTYLVGVQDEALVAVQRDHGEVRTLPGDARDVDSLASSDTAFATRLRSGAIVVTPLDGAPARKLDYNDCRELGADGELLRITRRNREVVELTFAEALAGVAPRPAAGPRLAVVVYQHEEDEPPPSDPDEPGEPEEIERGEPDSGADPDRKEREDGDGGVERGNPDGDPGRGDPDDDIERGAPEREPRNVTVVELDGREVWCSPPQVLRTMPELFRGCVHKAVLAGQGVLVVRTPVGDETIPAQLLHVPA